MDNPNNMTLNNENVYGNCASVFVSMEKETLGIVKSVSHQINYFGYEKNDIVGHNINKLMPGMLSSGHQKVIFEHLNYKEGQAQFI